MALLLGRQAAEFAADARDVALIAGQLCLHFSHAIEVLLVVAAFAALLLGLAVVVFLLQLRLAGLGLLELGFEHRAGFAIACALVDAFDARTARGRTRGCGRRVAASRTAARRLGALHDGD